MSRTAPVPEKKSQNRVLLIEFTLRKAVSEATCQRWFVLTVSLSTAPQHSHRLTRTAFTWANSSELHQLQLHCFIGLSDHRLERIIRWFSLTVQALSLPCSSHHYRQIREEHGQLSGQWPLRSPNRHRYCCHLANGCFCCCSVRMLTPLFVCTLSHCLHFTMSNCKKKYLHKRSLAQPGSD